MNFRHHCGKSKLPQKGYREALLPKRKHGEELIERYGWGTYKEEVGTAKWEWGGAINTREREAKQVKSNNSNTYMDDGMQVYQRLDSTNLNLLEWKK